MVTSGSSRIPSGLWPKPTPTGQHAWQDTNRSSGACLNASGRTVRNRAATRTVLTALRTILASDLAQRSEKLEPQQRGVFPPASFHELHDVGPCSQRGNSEDRGVGAVTGGATNTARSVEPVNQPGRPGTGAMAGSWLGEMTTAPACCPSR